MHNGTESVRHRRQQRARSALRRLVPHIDKYPRLMAGLMDAFEKNFRYILPRGMIDRDGNRVIFEEFEMDYFHYEAVWVRLFKQERKFIVYMLKTSRLKSPHIGSYKKWLQKITEYQYKPMPESLMDLYDILKNDVSSVASDRTEYIDMYKRLLPPEYYTIGSIYGTPTLNIVFKTTESEDFRLRTKYIWADDKHQPRPLPQPLDITSLL